MVVCSERLSDGQMEALRMNDTVLLEAWRGAMRIWIRWHDLKEVARYIAALHPDLREVLLSETEPEELHDLVAEELARKQAQPALL